MKGNSMGYAGSRPQPALIHLEGVQRLFETQAETVRALANVSISINAGEFVCITGPSGAGKSTLLNIIGCLDRPSEGKYLLAGRDVRALDDTALARLRRGVFGFVFQDCGLLDSMTAQRNVELSAAYAGISRTERAGQAQKLLRSFELDRRLTHFPTELSGGERQRVAISRALMNGRRVILADEPMGALDSRRSIEILSMFRQLASRGFTVVLVSHDSTIADAADRQIELVDGIVVGDSGAHLEAPELPRPTPTAARPHQELPAALAMREALHSLCAAPLRTAMLLIGAALGVASAVALLGLSNGVYQAVLPVMGSMGAGWLGVNQPSLPGIAAPDMEDVRSIERLGNVRKVVLDQFGVRPVQYGDKAVEEAEVYGIQEPPEFMGTQWPIERGEFITRQDGEEMAQLAVIDSRLRNALFPPGTDPLGEWIDVGGVSFSIKGVFAPHPIMENEAHRSQAFSPILWVPFMTGRNLLFGQETSMSITAYVHDVARLQETAAEVRDLLIRRLGHENFLMHTGEQIVGAYRAFVRLRVRALAAVAVASLLAGALVIMILMLGAVRQRKREIAIRMAVGAGRQDILRQFMSESCVIVLAGLIVGLPLGLLAGTVVEVVSDAPSAIEPWFIWAAAGAMTAAGLLSGILPAHRASRLDPVAALAAE